MGKVYAWKLVCGNSTKYCYLSSGGTFTADSCGGIDPCSAVYARTLQNEDAYAEAFNRMKAAIPENFRKTLKDYTAYWDIGCDKPADFEACV